MADMVNHVVLNIFEQLAKQLMRGELHAFWYFQSAHSTTVWTRSLKSTGVQKTSFLTKDNELYALSDVQICSKDELSREMKGNVLLHYE